MLVYDGLTSRWGMGFASLLINFSNIVFIVTLAQLVLWDKRRPIPCRARLMRLICSVTACWRLCCAPPSGRGRWMSSAPPLSPAGGLV
jgi:hypothetical protein